MTDQTLYARVYRVVHSNRHKSAKAIFNAIRASFPQEDIKTLIQILDEIIAKENQ